MVDAESSASQQDQPLDAKDTTTNFQRYHGTTLDTPFFHILMEPLLPFLRPVLKGIYSIRWELSRPLQIRVLPSYFPVIDFPGLKSLPYITIGQILLIIPLLAIFLAGYYLSFVQPDTTSSGKWTSYAIYATFLTASKTNSITALLLGISFERMIIYHNLSALTAVTLAFFHGYCNFAYNSGESQYGLSDPNTDLGKFLFDGNTNLMGSILTLSMIGLVTFSLFPIFRRKFFDFWLWTHVLFAFCVLIFAFLHGVHLILVVAFWWALDLVMRYVVMAGVVYSHKATLTVVKADIVMVSFPKPDNFNYNPGQFIQIAIPDIGLLAFHPISISSAPHEPLVTLHVRALGDWTKKLLKLAQEKDEVFVLMEGPYGALSVDIDDDTRYKMALCVSGGIGVTHCQSVAKSLLHDYCNGRHLTQVRFVWTIRDLSMLDFMPPLEDSVDLTGIEFESTRSNLELGSIHSAKGPNVEVGMADTDIEVADSSLSLPEEYHPLRVIETDVFLTKVNEEESIHFKQDPRNFHFGRPNLNAIIQDVKEEAIRQGITHVMVFACGPKALVERTREACRVESKTLFEMKGVTFDVHEEIFEY
jgi:predicted ferric reductase